ncbi:hypothetical protein MRX96_036096 [Rhipicephalus microplus]
MEETTRIAEMEKSRMAPFRCQVILTNPWTRVDKVGLCLRWLGTTPFTRRGVEKPLQRCLHTLYHIHTSQRWPYGDYLRQHPLCDEDEAAACTAVGVQLPFVVFPLVATSSERGEHGEGAASFMVTRMSGDVATPDTRWGEQKGACYAQYLWTPDSSGRKRWLSKSQLWSTGDDSFLVP